MNILFPLRLLGWIAFTSGFMTVTSVTSAPSRGMWVYETDAIMESARERASLLAFCGERGITDLFWQVHFSAAGEHPALLQNAEAHREFLREAHGASIRIHALTGDPSHVRSAKHGRVLAAATAVATFNRASEDDSRFDGFHLDVEPHGLPEWKKANLKQKCELLTEFVALHETVATRIREEGGSLIFGTDIVFWLDKVHPGGSAVYPVTYRGVKQDAARHLLEWVDHIAIMSYRRSVEGRNGILSLVGRTFDPADQGTAKIFVGVKMADIGSEMETFFGQTETEMMTSLGAVEKTFAPRPSYAGLAFFHYGAFRRMP